MRIIFMGTPEFAVPTLERIINAGHEVAAVVTQPDKARGRSRALAHPAVKEAALLHGIPVYQPLKVRDPEFVEVLRALESEVMVVVAFGQLLPKAVLDLPAYGCINVHASLLPKYRGAAPIQWAVIAGEPVSGVTTMFMDVGLDTGDMLLKREVVLEPDETGGSLHDKLAVVGADLLVETLVQLDQGTIQRTKQDDAMTGIYAKMLTKEMGLIDFSQSAESIERLIRGLNPWPSAYTRLIGKTLKIWRAAAVDRPSQGEAGEVIEIGKDYFSVQTGAGILKVYELQLEGKKRMEVETFLRGYSLQTGMKLGE